MQKLICLLHNKRKFKAIRKVKQFSSRTLLSIHLSLQLTMIMTMMMLSAKQMQRILLLLCVIIIFQVRNVCKKIKETHAYVLPRVIQYLATTYLVYIEENHTASQIKFASLNIFTMINNCKGCQININRKTVFNCLFSCILL